MNVVGDFKVRNSEEMAYGFIDEKHKDIAMAVISTVATFLFGEFNLVMQYLFAANIIDIFTGIGRTSRYETIGSRIFFEGIRKKIGFWVLVFIANMVDVAIIGTGEFTKTAVIMMLLGVEGASILENIVAWGVEAPGFLSKYLAQVKEQTGNNGSTPPMKQANKEDNNKESE